MEDDDFHAGRQAGHVLLLGIGGPCVGRLPLPIPCPRQSVAAPQNPNRTHDFKRAKVASLQSFLRGMGLTRRHIDGHAGHRYRLQGVAGAEDHGRGVVAQPPQHAFSASCHLRPVAGKHCWLLTVLTISALPNHGARAT